MIKLKKKNYNATLTEKLLTTNGNCENVPNLEINEVVLVYCNIVNNNY